MTSVPPATPTSAWPVPVVPPVVIVADSESDASEASFPVAVTRDAKRAISEQLRPRHAHKSEEVRSPAGDRRPRSPSNGKRRSRPSSPRRNGDTPSGPAMDADYDERDFPIKRIVLTGGPCGGKTSSLAKITSHFERLGWKVFRVPEAATTLITGGVAFPELPDDEARYQFQVALVKTMMNQEDIFYWMAKAMKKKALLLCDRGTMDCSAYMDVEQWQAMLDENHWTEVQLRDERYDCIVHLVTAAEGAEAFYTCENNAARSENPEEAAALDWKLQQAWVGHPAHTVVDNSTDFANKIMRAVDAVCEAAGEAVLKEGIETRFFKRKFLIERASVPEDFPVKSQDFNLHYLYLTNFTQRDIRERLIKRGQYGTFTYILETAEMIGGKLVETQRMISGREYISMTNQADPTRVRVVKKRRCFLYKNRSFKLDWFEEPRHLNLSILECLTTDELDGTVLPDFLQVGKEVTSSEKFATYSLAAKSYHTDLLLKD